MPLVTCLGLAAGCGDKMEAHLDKFMGYKSERQSDFGSPPDVYSLAESDKAADRIHSMTFAEAAHRLGAHRFRSGIDFRFGAGGHYTSLKEQALIVQAQNGDFRVKVDNDGGQGYEVVFSGGALFIRTRYGPFNERSVLDRIHLRNRDATYEGWGAVYRLFRGRLVYSKLGLARHFGRDALKFSIGLAGLEPRLPGAREQPAAPEGVKKYVYPIEPTPSERDRWRDKAVPTRARGTMLVDLDTGVVLKVDFSGQLRWSDEQGGEAGLSMSVHMETDGFGNPPAIAAPEADTIKPLPERVMVDTHPLDFFFGKGFTARLGPPAGVARRSKAERDAETTNSGGSTSKP